MKNRFIYIVLFSFLIFSCDDYLDVEPLGKVIPSTTEDYNLLLNFSPETSDMAMMAFAADDYQASPGFIGDISDPDNTLVKQHIWGKNLYLPEEQVALWNTPYSNIYTCNFVINNVIDAQEGDDEEKSRMVAEARVLRAYEHYILVNSFAPQYDPSTAATDPGVFIVTKDDVNGTPGDKRESIQEVYDFIIQDISESIANLPVEGITNFRPTKAASYALLARVYLQMGDFEKAKTNADLALNQSTSKALVDYTVPGFFEGVHNTEQYMIKTYSMGRFFWYGYLSDEMASLFDYNQDARIGTIWSQQWEYSDATGWIIGNNLDASFLANINHCVSIPEMYLIRAECNARLTSGTIGDVIADLNTLGEKRFFNYIPLTVADVGSKDLALLMVLEERRRELAFSANRWFDLKRLNKEPSLAKTIEHVLENGESYTLAPNANNYVFPIPETVLSFYPDLEVYPRD